MRGRGELGGLLMMEVIEQGRRIVFQESKVPKAGKSLDGRPLNLDVLLGILPAI